MPETVFYRDRNVLITSKRAVFGRKTYALANITAFDVEAFHPYSWWATAILVGAVGLSVYAWVENRFTLLFGGVGLGGLSIWIALLSHYRLLFHSGKTEIVVLQTRYRARIEELLEALNLAIVERH